MLEERARQSLSSSTISCLSLWSLVSSCVCVCVFMCWIAKYLCWSSVGEAFFTHVPAASHLRSAARERKKRKIIIWYSPWRPGWGRWNRWGSGRGTPGSPCWGPTGPSRPLCLWSQQNERLVSAKFTRCAHATHRRRGCARCSWSPHCCFSEKNCFGSSPVEQKENAQLVMSHVDSQPLPGQNTFIYQYARM